MSCVLYQGSIKSNAHLSHLVRQTFSNWRKAVEVFDRHTEMDYHKQSIILLDNLARFEQKRRSFLIIFSQIFFRVLNNQQPSIVTRVSNERQLVISENRAYLKAIIETLMVCGQQEIALRGHTGSGSLQSEVFGNDGNFRAMLRYRLQGEGDGSNTPTVNG